MVERIISTASLDRNVVYDTPRLDANVVHQVDPNTQGLDALVQGLDKFMEEVSHKLDKATVRKAQLAGSTAGLGVEFEEKEGSTLYAEAYNKAGIEVFTNRKLSEASISINDIATDPTFRNDPVRLAQALEDNREEYLADIPLSAVPEFSVAYDDRGSRAIQAAQSNQVELTLSENAAQAAQTETILTADVTNAARGGDEKAIEQYRTELFSLWDKQSGLTMMPEEIATKKIALQQTIQKEVVIGEFLSQPADKRPAYISSFIKDNPLGKIMTPDQVFELKNDMVSAWRVDDDLKDAAKAQTKETNDKAADDALITFHLAPTPENFTEYSGMEGVDASEIKAARLYLVSNINEADPVVDYNINQAMMEGRYTDARRMLSDPTNYSALPRRKVQEYREQLSDIAGGAGFEDTKGWKEVTRRIKAEYGSNSLWGRMLSPEGEQIQQQLYDELRTSYPKYLTGEIAFEKVDPIRLYVLKKGNSKKTLVPSGTEVITESRGSVIIPQKWVDDPLLFEKETAVSIHPDFDTPEVATFMALKKIELLQSQNKGKDDGK